MNGKLSRNGRSVPLHYAVTEDLSAVAIYQRLRTTRLLRACLPKAGARCERDPIFGTDFRDQVRDMAIEEVLSAPRSP